MLLLLQLPMVAREIQISWRKYYILLCTSYSGCTQDVVFQISKSARSSRVKHQVLTAIIEFCSSVHYGCLLECRSSTDSNSAWSFNVVSSFGLLLITRTNFQAGYAEIAHLLFDAFVCNRRVSETCATRTVLTFNKARTTRVGPWIH